MKTGILFDLDGTLLNTLEDLTDATNFTLQHYGCPTRTIEEVRRFVGNGARRLIELALPGKESDPPVDEVLAFYQEYYASHAQIKTRPYDGILKALEHLTEKYPVGIVSNKPDKAVKILCKQYFGSIYARGESDSCPRKPAPDMVHMAMKELGVSRCIYVGDSEVDVITARNAGVPCLSVLWGFRDKEAMVEVGGKYFCDDPRSLVSALESLM